MNNLWGLLTPENAEYTLFGVFGLVILLFLIMDLGLFSRKAKKMTFKTALIQSMIWVSIAVGYSALIWYFGRGNEVADAAKAAEVLDKRDFLDFLTAYLTEYSLSVDNIFVFIVILRYFKIDEKYHHKVLYYGVFGAIFFRAIFIFGTSAIVSTSWGHYVLYLFGAFLIYTGFKLLFTSDDDDFDPESNRFYRILKRNLRVTNQDSLGKLTTRIDGKLHFTILFLVIALIETTDVVFALDSIPAVFSITQDKFVIYTSNIFAVMGLRAMFFMLEGLIHRFHLLQKGISLVLLFIGAKMLLEIVNEFRDEHNHIEIPHFVSFLVILGVLTGSVLLSLAIKKKEPEPKN